MDIIYIGMIFQSFLMHLKIQSFLHDINKFNCDKDFLLPANTL